jgi:hypothetical protein
MTTRADHIARRGLEHEAFEHARWTPLASPAPRRRLRGHLRARLTRSLGFYALTLAMFAPWLRVLALLRGFF